MTMLRRRNAAAQQSARGVLGRGPCTAQDLVGQCGAMRSPEPSLICACIGSSRFRSFSFLQNVRWNSRWYCPQEFEHVLHVRGRLAIIAKQSLAAAALIESGEGLVNAKHEIGRAHV